jgi:hypothetical protein
MRRPLILLSLLLAGCSALPTMPSPESGAAAVRIAVSSAGTLALARNPGYVPVARDLITGIDAAVGDGATITPETIREFVRRICAKRGLPAADSAVFVSLTLTAYDTYETTYKTAVVKSTDPVVLLYVEAFKRGLSDAVLAISQAP